MSTKYLRPFIMEGLVYSIKVCREAASSWILDDRRVRKPIGCLQIFEIVGVGFGRVRDILDKLFAAGVSIVCGSLNDTRSELFDGIG